MPPANGELTERDLSPIPGGRLRADAADAWLAMRRRIASERGLWICPTSPRTSYRSYADQEHFWRLYQSGRGALAARPGSSNHGWGIAVDLPRPEMAAAVRAVAHEYGWGIAGGKLRSDAMSEWWHCTFHPGVYKGGAAKPKHVHPYKLMSDKEREARDILLHQRRVARRAGGWSQVDEMHLRKAKQAKKDLRQYAVNLRVAAERTGWDENHRRARYAYINQLIGA
ncbi:D-alanyl-D-alanine carboxypeptidase family protein [Solirubrobacter sp. CPCC 204708]|uniref:M15 family metallopeptidase n=1 Tax=Solirubrobacter deserti TaxID=2282478 RepID=A0ABT4RMF9_9ACTN|nr:M15 family metallopeptidase [Solirubrobacter deserti]MBE2314471.1 D-alanyl-D-alanine carboxypeptidase family protein [Solirubrobacter deserti]MDA0139618.1 M15 family metallopeptidase [Solirubrobacter deserti]